MTEQELTPQEKEQQYLKGIIRDYLRYGSVDRIFSSRGYDLALSYPAVHRLIRNWGIVKSAGPNSKLSEAIAFLVSLSRERIPLETLYRNLPATFKVSMGTLHRILHNIKEGVIRRYGTALVVTKKSQPNMVLIAEDVSPPRLEVGKTYGSLSLPMGFSKKDEESEDSVLRVLQQEVFTEYAVERAMPDVVPQVTSPFMFLDIADVRVGVLHLALPDELAEERGFSSFKLRNYRYLHASQISQSPPELNFRAGIREIAEGYKKFRESQNPAGFVLFEKSSLNIELKKLALELSRPLGPLAFEERA